MRGIYNVEIYNKRVSYKIEINRNITIIEGSSATGKTEMIKMIDDYITAGQDSGVTLNIHPAVDIYVIHQSKDWINRLSAIKNALIFIDEGNTFVKTKEFAQIVKDTGNYFILITREPIKTLPYSVKEIYTMTGSTQHFLKRKYPDELISIGNTTNIEKNYNRGFQYK